ncbi:MAG: VOC family protein [Hamadaea sp.]|nr:VOC family protein [Hamadaea sp.]
MFSIVIQCTDPYVTGPFWSLATELPIDAEDAEKIAARTLAPGESVVLHDPSGTMPDIWITPVAQPRPAGRVHLDVHVPAASLPSRLAELQAAGASVVRRTPRLIVLADPDGTEFCLLVERG